MKKLLLVILSIFLIQIGTYFLIGKDSLPLEVAKNRRNFAGEFVENIYFSFQPKLSMSDSQRVKSYFEDELNHKVIGSRAEHKDKKMCEYKVRIKHKFYFISDVNSANGFFVANDNEVYVEVFESKYIWILFKWFKLQDENTAQS
ncbi:hypothetical protein V9L05_23815 (plasmid) [Bernardetia sp. Wsw4-3y2]|uniref:hypothetical protein n=1 Tax=Bernardetia sp. Wsw4-3y2 TaxID=3127471 RepID=UPI0030CEB21F